MPPTPIKPSIPDTLEGYYDPDKGKFYVPDTPEQDAIYRELYGSKVILPTSSLDIDEYGFPTGSAPTPSLLDDITYAVEGTPPAYPVPESTTLPSVPSLPETSTADLLVQQAKAQLETNKQFSDMEQARLNAQGRQVADTYGINTLLEAEEFRRGQRPLARTAATSGFGPGQFARLASQSQFDYNAAKTARDLGFQYDTDATNRAIAAEAAALRDRQAQALSSFVMTPGEQQALIEALTRG